MKHGESALADAARCVLVFFISITLSVITITSIHYRKNATYKL